MTDDVTKLPIAFKAPADTEDAPVLERVAHKKCWHEGTYEVDEAEAEVTCSRCGEKLNPMWVLARLSDAEHRYHRARQSYQDEMRRLAARSRTKCRCCGKMTTISAR